MPLSPPLVEYIIKEDRSSVSTGILEVYVYGRVTYEMQLVPFTLKECEELFKENQVKISRYDIIQAYMIVGGIPFYLGYFEKGLSLAQSIDQMFYTKNAFLKNEYERLFKSAFQNPDMTKVLVEFLNTRHGGFTRKEISEKSGFSKGGSLSDALQALEACGFVEKYVPFGMGKKEERYKLVDPFCIFYLKFVKDKKGLDTSFWAKNVTSQAVASWRGLAFENTCFSHIDQIKAALGISGVTTTTSGWSMRDAENDGTQIDMIIERNDHVVNACEMKYYSKEFVVNKEYHRTLATRQGILEGFLDKGFVVHNTLITTYGLKYNEYSGDFDNVITIEELFR